MGVRLSMIALGFSPTIRAREMATPRVYGQVLWPSHVLSLFVQRVSDSESSSPSRDSIQFIRSKHNLVLVEH